MEDSNEEKLITMGEAREALRLSGALRKVHHAAFIACILALLITKVSVN